MKTPIRKKRLSKKLVLPLLLIEIAVTQVGLTPSTQAASKFEPWICELIPVNVPPCTDPGPH